MARAAFFSETNGDLSRIVHRDTQEIVAYFGCIERPHLFSWDCRRCGAHGRPVSVDRVELNALAHQRRCTKPYRDMVPE